MTTSVSVPRTTPPAWANAVIKLLLKTPVVERIIGRSLMLLTFTGKKSGKRYTIPVSYARSGDRVLAVTKVFRSWWKNFPTNPDVSVRLAGRDHPARAAAAVGTTADFTTLQTYLSARPMDARAYGVRRRDGALVPEDVQRLLPQIVLIDIELIG